jgi:NADH-quinone oxidoreductase subunit K
MRKRIAKQGAVAAGGGAGSMLTGLTLTHFLVLGLLLFLLGAYCVLSRRNAIGILLGIELILNAANINYIAFSFYGGSAMKYDGQVFAIFVIMLAAAEAVIGLAIVLAIYQNLRTIDVAVAETMSG